MSAYLGTIKRGQSCEQKENKQTNNQLIIIHIKSQEYLLAVLLLGLTTCTVNPYQVCTVCTYHCLRITVLTTNANEFKKHSDDFHRSIPSNSPIVLSAMVPAVPSHPRWHTLELTSGGWAGDQIVFLLIHQACLLDAECVSRVDQKYY